MKTVEQLIPSRRDLLRLGGYGLLGAAAEGFIPDKVSAAPGKSVTPRGNARNVLFYEINGAIAHTESWDYKEDAGNPKDLDMRRLRDDLWISETLFPTFKNHIDKFAIHRTLLSHEEVHFRGQYYVQTGRPLNLAFAREIPAVGSMMALELEPRRRPNDTFPIYLSFNLEKAFPGALSTGFLDPRFSVVDINPELAGKGGSLDEAAMELMAERWRLLTELRHAQRTRLVSMGRQMAGYEAFYDAAYEILSDSRWPKVFQLTEDDRKRYGETAVGVSCALARNALKADAGTHYIHICHPGWDHHVDIWTREAKTSHYQLCAEFDQAFSALMEDLATTSPDGRPEQTLLDETLVVAMSEFGRTPGPLNPMAGRDHYNKVFPALFAGAGVEPGLILGQSDSAGEKCLDTGWDHREQPRIENVISTMMSALGIDWTKRIGGAPSGRTFVYVDPLSAPGQIPTDEISSIYG